MVLLAPFYPLGEDYQFHFTLTTIIAPSCAAILLMLGETCYAYTCMKTTPMHTIQPSKHQRQREKKNISQLFYIMVCCSAPTVNGNMALPRGIGSIAKASEYVCSPLFFIFCHSILLKWFNNAQLIIIFHQSDLPDVILCEPSDYLPIGFPGDSPRPTSNWYTSPTRKRMCFFKHLSHIFQ